MRIGWQEISAKKALFRLDGVFCNSVIEADDKQCYVERYRRGSSRKLVVEGGFLIVERVAGRVEIGF